MNINDHYRYAVTENITIVATISVFIGFIVSVVSNLYVLSILLFLLGVVLYIVESLYMLTYLRHIKLYKGSVTLLTSIRLLSYIIILFIFSVPLTKLVVYVLFYLSITAIFYTIYMEGEPKKYNGWY